jgi:hypothetical protein
MTNTLPIATAGDEWTIDALDLDAYLQRIGCVEPLTLDASTLLRLHRAHVAAIPFENLDVDGSPYGISYAGQRPATGTNSCSSRLASLAKLSSDQAVTPGASCAGPRATGGSGQNRRDILEHLQPTVEGAVTDHVKRDVGVRVVDPIPTTASGDDRKDDHAETVDEPSAQEGAAQGEAAHGAHGLGALLLHLAHRLDGVLGDESGVRPGQRLGQRGREDDLRHARQGTCARLAVGGQPGHEPVCVRAHQDRVVRLRLVSQPGEVLGPFQAPPAGPALRGPVSIKRGDEVDRSSLPASTAPFDDAVNRDRACSRSRPVRRRKQLRTNGHGSIGQPSTATSWRLACADFGSSLASSM